MIKIAPSFVTFYTSGTSDTLEWAMDTRTRSLHAYVQRKSIATFSPRKY